MPNFIAIRPSAAELLHLIDLQDGGHSVNIAFQFGDVSQLRMSKSICSLNFDNVAQSVAFMFGAPAMQIW